MVNTAMEIGFIMAAMPGKPSANLFTTPRGTTHPPSTNTEPTEPERECRNSTDSESILKGIVFAPYFYAWSTSFI